jgi:hypothetical protein
MRPRGVIAEPFLSMLGGWRLKKEGLQVLMGWAFPTALY